MVDIKIVLTHSSDKTFALVFCCFALLKTSDSSELIQTFTVTCSNNLFALDLPPLDFRPHYV